jgi:hypothetical protein
LFLNHQRRRRLLRRRLFLNHRHRRRLLHRRLFLNHQHRRRLLYRRLFLNHQRRLQRRHLHPVMMTTMTTMIIAKCKMIEPRARRVRGRAGCAGVCPRDV